MCRAVSKKARLFVEGWVGTSRQIASPAEASGEQHVIVKPRRRQDKRGSQERCSSLSRAATHTTASHPRVTHITTHISTARPTPYASAEPQAEPSTSSTALHPAYPALHLPQAATAPCLLQRRRRHPQAAARSVPALPLAPPLLPRVSPPHLTAVLHRLAPPLLLLRLPRRPLPTKSSAKPWT